MDEYRDAIETLVEDARVTGAREGTGNVQMGNGGSQDEVEEKQVEGNGGKKLKRKVRIVEYPQEIQ
jgi:hypothetical protein